MNYKPVFRMTVETNVLTITNDRHYHKRQQGPRLLGDKSYASVLRTEYEPIRIGRSNKLHQYGEKYTRMSKSAVQE